MRKLKLYIAMSLDGYIAKKDDNLDFLSLVERPDEDYGYADFMENIDIVIIGRRTFDKVLSFGQGAPYKDKDVFVISRTKQGKEEHVTYVNNVVELVESLKQKPGKDIYCDGGSEVIKELLDHQLFDDIIISIIPHLLGDGIRLFNEGFIEQDLLFQNTVTYSSGLVQIRYSAKK